MSEKHFMGAEDYQHSTDSIIAGYENKLNQSISLKIVSSSKNGKLPEFTDEETLYISKKASEVKSLLDEVDVITPVPNITLKKGNTELNIGHAVSIAKKMEEKYPIGSSNSVENLNLKKKIYKSKGKMYYGLQKDEDDVEFVMDKQNTMITYDSELEKSKFNETKSPSKNAYEIRADILSQALSWVQYKKTFLDAQSNTPQIPTEEEVLDVAQKFYKFVENRR